VTYLADVFMWCWCWLACQLVSALPITRRGSLVDRFTFWLLPFAGYYGYHVPGLTPWRWSRRFRVRPEPEPGAPF
jgi:hypothetical protein